MVEIIEVSISLNGLRIGSGLPDVQFLCHNFLVYVRMSMGTSDRKHRRKWLHGVTKFPLENFADCDHRCIVGAL